MCGKGRSTRQGCESRGRVVAVNLAPGLPQPCTAAACRTAARDAERARAFYAPSFAPHQRMPWRGTMALARRRRQRSLPSRSWLAPSRRTCVGGWKEDSGVHGVSPGRLLAGAAEAAKWPNRCAASQAAATAVQAARPAPDRLSALPPFPPPPAHTSGRARSTPSRPEGRSRTGRVNQAPRRRSAAWPCRERSLPQCQRYIDPRPTPVCTSLACSALQPLHQIHSVPWVGEMPVMHPRRSAAASTPLPGPPLPPATWRIHTGRPTPPPPPDPSLPA